MIWHLACLASTGKIEALKSYQNFLETNKVAQYATSYSLFSCVNRAVEFAEEHFIPCGPSEKANFIGRMMFYFMVSPLLYRVIIKPFTLITKAFLHMVSWIRSKARESFISRVLRFGQMKNSNEQKVKDIIGSQDWIVLNTIVEQLKTMGWTTYRDKNYNYNAYFISKDRLINIVYSLEREGKELIITFKASLSTLSFSTIYRDIFPTRSQYTSIKEAEDIYTISDIAMKQGKLKQVCADIFEWTHQQNVQKIISDYAVLSPNNEADLAERHLVALILMGDVKTLKFYKESFRVGKHLDFSEEITKDLMNRVLILARRY
ncbi:DUF6990 domain-containing protein [Bartonella sp. AC326YNZD]|uniref:DUF6990 domain-containing protein n=1 Tax=Bartonella sp. AC326YNZD TaxID=3243451 RepID=UPI0035D0432F